MDQDLFIDGFGTIRMAGGVIRVELLRAAFDEGAERPRLEPKGQLVMTPDAFLRGYHQLGEVAKRLLAETVAHAARAKAAAAE